MVRKFSQSIPRKLASLFRPISLGIYALAAGSVSVLPLLWWRFFLGDLVCPEITDFLWGFPIFFGRTAPWMRATSREV